jgi:cytochrome c oxidase assembly protein subunit 11
MNGDGARATPYEALITERPEPMPSHYRKNWQVIVPCLAVLALMCGIVAYSPTLYRMFCAATGYGGTTQRTATASAAVSPQTVTVDFDASVAPGLDWRFAAVERSVTVHLGEQRLVYFSAENLGSAPAVAHATFNVTPQTSGIYFNKIQCFCFDEERLNAHQKVEMPVVFYVDPAFGKDPEMRGVSLITLGYTLFRSANPQNAKNLSRFLADAPPDAVHGQALFAERCSACHAVDRNKLGPKLAGVVGRRVGSAAGFNYSSALKNADFVWSADRLDRWLADPRAFIPGTKMPVRVLDAPSRKDLIAYLQKAGEANKRTAAGAASGQAH